MAFSLKSVLNQVGTAATGGAWSPDGSSGFMQGGSGMLDVLPDGISSLIPGIGDAQAAALQNKMNIAAAQRQMDFQERMSNTAYQRAMDDMRKAGLNPMLAFSQGGASTPSGSTPTINSQTKSKFGEMAISTALGVRGLQQQQQSIDTQNNVAESTINLNKANAAKQLADTQNTQADTQLKKRELRGRGVMDTLDKAGGSVIQKLIDSMSNSAKDSRSSKPVIKVLGPSERKLFDGPMIKPK